MTGLANAVIKPYAPPQTIELRLRQNHVCAYLIPLTFHASPESYDVVVQLLEGLIFQCTEAAGCIHEGFVQGQFRVRESAHLFADAAVRWLPETGLGVFPHRAPPRMMVDEDLENFDPNVPMEPLVHVAYRVTTGIDGRLDCLRTMTGTGAPLQILSPREHVVRELNEILLGYVTDRMYRMFPLYVPLLNLAGLQQPSEVTEAVLRPLKLYIRESWEDGGILIVSDQPLTRALHELNCQAVSVPEGADEIWALPGIND